MLAFYLTAFCLLFVKDMFQITLLLSLGDENSTNELCANIILSPLCLALAFSSPEGASSGEGGKMFAQSFWKEMRGSRWAIEVEG